MLHGFLKVDHGKLVDHCQVLAAARVPPRPSCDEMRYGVTKFSARVIDMLRNELAAGLPNEPSETDSARTEERLGGKTIVLQKMTTPTSDANGQR